MIVCSMALRGARGALWWEAQPGGWVLYGPSAAREAAPAACAGSLRLRTPFIVVRCLSGGTRAAGRGLGKEAHETVSWEKRLRGARSPQLLVAPILALAMTHVVMQA